jgi:hypothetical protein
MSSSPLCLGISKVGSRVRQKHSCLGFVFIAAIVTTRFGRAWPSSGDKLTLYTNEEKKHNCIQGISRLYGITAVGDFLGLCDEKSSYKHVSDFGRFRSYDRLKLRIEGNDY